MFCSNCGKELLDNSKFCSHCGVNLKSSQQGNSEPKKILIEKTAKKYKKQYLISSLIVIIGLLIGVSNFDISDSGEMNILRILGTTLFFVGIVWTIIVKFLIWWQHE